MEITKELIEAMENHMPVIRKMGIKITESSSAESEDYLNLITIQVRSTEMASTVSGTIFGRKDPRIVKINKFRLEMIPSGHMALINNIDRPGGGTSLRNLAWGIDGLCPLRLPLRS